MYTVIGRYAPYAFALLRIMSGLLFAMHGTQKLFGFPPSGRPPVALASVAGLAGVLELVLGVMIALGFLTGISAFVASGEMAVAYFWKHAPDGFFPLVNRGELAVVYCFLFLFIAAHGAGIWSIDSMLQRRLEEPTPTS